MRAMNATYRCVDSDMNKETEAMQCCTMCRNPYYYCILVTFLLLSAVKKWVDWK
ncbi:hypothetical protein BDV25DRAFT_167254 [Aspergillus avenaceus]|uniref:Uncharacterized protein n=1 Tax=Aspergillus avenaceus TaxID=36643 RepID=A0A5N6TDM8_ASPAV|nr:hypothetical protein BDV25DRAFT_167254 [Aspergillus avenaceus]